MAIALESGIGMIEVGVYTAQHNPIAAHRIVFMSSISPDKPATSAQSAPISLPRVRALFSRPGRVAESQFLRREISARMFERLSLIKTDPLAVLDAGGVECAGHLVEHAVGHDHGDVAVDRKSVV